MNTMVGQASINGAALISCRLTIEQDVTYETSALPRWNTSWHLTDSAGHYHAYAEPVAGFEREKFPTLERRRERRECDGSCGGVCEGEGYHVDRYFCRICQEEIKPGKIDGPYSFAVPGLIQWHVEVDVFLQLREMVSVRIEAPDRMLFGIALAADVQIQGFGDRVSARTKLVGAGPLGQRHAAKAKAA